MTIRKRFTSDELKASALEAARNLLIENGPQSVTLKAVGLKIGRTHANLLHHFGSASGLQKELAAYLATTICESIKDAVLASRAGQGTPRDVVDLIFDAFDVGGAAALASWMLLTGNEDALDPVVEEIHALVDELNPEEASGVERSLMHETTLTLVLLALGNAQLGGALARSLNLPEDCARDRAASILAASLFDKEAPQQ